MPDRAEHADRAQQFMPFASLKGYYDMVRARERVAEPRHELTEDEAEALSRRIANLRRGAMATVTHYDGDAYVKTTGMMTAIDTTFRTLTVVRTTIAFDDILDIEEDEG